jgi:predicted RNA binding protein YcfA (HicA-like mRNA interferase family)
MGQFDGFTSREVRRVVETFGWELARSRGSHFIFIHPEHPRSVAIPAHDEMGGGLLISILRQMDIPRDEFLRRAKK